MGQEYTGYRTWLAFCGECCEQEQAAREGLDGKRWIAEDKEDTHAKKKKKGGHLCMGVGVTAALQVSVEGTQAPCSPHTP